MEWPGGCEPIRGVLSLVGLCVVPAWDTDATPGNPDFATVAKLAFLKLLRGSAFIGLGPSMMGSD